MSVTMLSKNTVFQNQQFVLFKKMEYVLIIDTLTQTLKPSKKCTLKMSAFPLLEEKLYNWFLKQRNENFLEGIVTIKTIIEYWYFHSQ